MRKYILLVLADILTVIISFVSYYQSMVVELAEQDKKIIINNNKNKTP